GSTAPPTYPIPPAVRWHATPPPPSHPLSLHDALPIYFPLNGDTNDYSPEGNQAGNLLTGATFVSKGGGGVGQVLQTTKTGGQDRSEEHTSELQSREELVCRLPLEKQTGARHQALRDVC